MKLEYQIICVDTTSKVKVKNEDNLLHLLLSNGELWENGILQKKVISEKDKSLTCSVNRISSEFTDNTIPQISYVITLCGDFEKLAPLRIKLLEFVSTQSFDHNYVIKDDVSKNISCELYPLINELETLLRGYLMKFFITKLGVKWWDITADSEMKQKAVKRKNNEKVFSNYIDNKVFLIDFGELGKMVYALSSGYINKDDILNKLLNIEESVDALKNLKDELQSNYNKYFKDTFKDKQFQKKWESIEKLRHKVAHNNLFTQDDLLVGKKDCQELVQIIEVANKTIDELEFTELEIENIVDNSLNHISELYGDFIKAWKILESQVHRIAEENTLIESGKKYTNSILIFHNLRKKEIIDNSTSKNLEKLFKYRNMLVHSPNVEFYEFEKELPKNIRLTLEVIDILYKK
jgi:hypothetical protein